MAYCKNCGTQLEVDAKFCKNCGTATHSESFQDTVKDKFNEFNNTSEYTAEATDVADNKFSAILSYIGILVLVPIFAAKNSPFARFHANQGLVLLISTAAYSITIAIISAILTWITPVFSVIAILLRLGQLFFVAMMVLGIVNAAKGKMKELPLFGNIRILK